MLTAFSMMKIAGHSSVTVSERYVHPTPGGMDRAFDRLERLNAEKCGQAEAEAKAEAAGGSRVPANVTKVKNRRSAKSPQVVAFTGTGA